MLIKITRDDGSEVILDFCRIEFVGDAVTMFDSDGRISGKFSVDYSTKNEIIKLIINNGREYEVYNKC